MITRKISKKEVMKMKELYNKNVESLNENNKTGKELRDYFEKKYKFESFTDEKITNDLKEFLSNNEFYKMKVKDKNGMNFYLYKNDEAFVVIEEQIGYFQVESKNIKEAKKIYDDLFLYRGLDEYDLKNFIIVAQYIQLNEK